MQIHELNNFSGSIDNNSFVAVDNGADTGKLAISNIVGPVNERIDNIITSPAPTEQEIIDARRGADGYDYASLGDAIRDQFDDINADIKSMKWVSEGLVTGSLFTIDAYSDRSVQTGTGLLQLSTQAGFNSYSFWAAKDLIIAADFLSGYYAIGTLLDPNSDEWLLDGGGTPYVTGTSPTRYRSSDNNLPTTDSPLTISAGTLVVVTVNNDLIPSLMVNELVLKDFATEGFVETEINKFMNNRELFNGIDLRNTNEFVVETYANRNASLSTTGGYPSITLDPLNNYYTYTFVADKNIDVAVYGSANDYIAIAVLSNPVQSSWAPSGQVYYKQGSATVRKRKSENNLPTIESPMTIAKGSCVCLTVKVNETAGILIRELTNDTIQNIAVGENSKYIEVEMHSDYFYYYIPTVSGYYLRYKFVHFVDNGMNADGWVQRTVDLVSHSKKIVITPVVNDGEWEMAIMITGRPDFIGCMNHGSEISTIVNFYFDGVNSAITDGKSLVCKEIKINQKSTMYDPADETTIVGYHYKTYIITADGIEIRQRIEWVTAQNLGLSYTCMLPAIRGNDTYTPIQVTDRAYDEKTFTEYDCSTTSMDPYLTNQNDKGDRFNLYGTASGFSLLAECFMKDRPDSACAFLSNAVYYNKIYFAHNGTNYDVANGDVWEWVSKYKIAYAPN